MVKSSPKEAANKGKMADVGHLVGALEDRVNLLFDPVLMVRFISGAAIVTIFLQMAVKGEWNVPVYQIVINFVSLMYFSIASFTFFWKKLFPNDTPPDVIVPVKTDNNYGTLTK